MFPLVLVVLAASDPVAVVVSSKRPGSDAVARKVAVQVVGALISAGFKTPLDDEATVALLEKSKLNPRDCQGSSPCVATLAAALGPDALLVAVDVGRIGDSLAIHLEAATGDGVARGAIDVPSEIDLWSAQVGAFDRFAASLFEKLTPPAPVAPNKPVAALPVDAPTPAALEPPIARPVPAFVEAPREPSKTRSVVPWVVGAGAAGALAVSATFLVFGSQDKSVYDNSVGADGVSSLTGSELQRLSSQANLRFTVSASTAVLTVALAAVCAFLVATSE